jgi:hypothetical protein
VVFALPDGREADAVGQLLREIEQLDVGEAR